jgi:hypothetical protein
MELGRGEISAGNTNVEVIGNLLLISHSLPHLLTLKHFFCEPEVRTFICRTHVFVRYGRLCDVLIFILNIPSVPFLNRNLVLCIK